MAYRGPKFVTWMDQLSAEEKAEVKASVESGKDKSVFACLKRLQKNKGHVRARLSKGDEKRKYPKGRLVNPGQEEKHVGKKQNNKR